MQRVAVNIQYNVIGETFGARSCSSSCSCNPCDCNPCTCGSSALTQTQPNYPYWRISGYALRKGSIDNVDISQCLLVCLAQPQDTSRLDGSWSEVLLVNEQATEAQIQALLALFEDQLHSLPAEIGSQPSLRRAVYQVPMQYSQSRQGPSLSLSFQPTENLLVRQGESRIPSHAWEYQGPLALREIVRYHS